MIPKWVIRPYYPALRLSGGSGVDGAIDGVFDQFRRRMNTEPRHDAGLVELSGLHSDAEMRCDFLRRVSLRHKPQDLALTRGERGRWRQERRESFFGDGRAHIRVALQHFPHGR